MADPLGLIGGSAQGAGALRPGSSGPASTQNKLGDPAFKDALTSSLDKLNSAQQEATAAAEDLASGNRADVENVLLATQKADMAFKMALALRNKVQAAFEELKQVRI